MTYGGQWGPSVRQEPLYRFLCCCSSTQEREVAMVCFVDQNYARTD